MIDPKKTIGRIPQLDGLRAVAVLLVFTFHHSLIRSGWVGVDIFFVLSGFLITGILRRDTANPNYWKSFYTKRVTRILPPLLAVVIAVLVTLQHFRFGYLGYVLFGSNIVELTPYALAPLGALWSLAIEEHFYFAWPFVVKKMQWSTLVKVSLGIVLISPLLRAAATLVFRSYWGVNHNWNSPIFLLTPFRLDGLASGALLSLLLEHDKMTSALKRWSGALCVAAFGVFFALELWLSGFRRTADSVLFNSMGYSLVVLGSFCLVSFLMLKPTSLPAKLLALAPFVFIGTISYGCYLYQAPIKILMQHLLPASMPAAGLLFVDAIATIGVATISFYLMEKPIIAWGRKIGGGARERKASSELEQIGHPPPTFRKSAQAVENERLTSGTFLKSEKVV
jgi:peptidoglycan/LPS O-acetylase OafA/YrhL